MLNNLDDDTTYKLRKINSVLHSRYGVEIDYSVVDHAKLSEMEAVRDGIICESAFNSYHTNPTYTKLTLICEAVRLYLREIAPRRIRRKSKGV